MTFFETMYTLQPHESKIHTVEIISLLLFVCFSIAEVHFCLKPSFVVVFERRSLHKRYFTKFWFSTECQSWEGEIPNSISRFCTSKLFSTTDEKKLLLLLLQFCCCWQNLGCATLGLCQYNFTRTQKEKWLALFFLLLRLFLISFCFVVEHSLTTCNVKILPHSIWSRTPSLGVED